MGSILKEKTPGTCVLAYGYEAVARGALEADVKVVSGFPGTPSSGCTQALAAVAKDENIHVEWATNERVALEVAWGAAMNGQRAMCTMNHLGMNVVIDSLKYCNNYGVTGGMVIFVGDDVGANTSAIESDSRVLASAADVPVLCPATPDEARQMTAYAFELSEMLGCPVVVRSVCQLMMTQSANADTFPMRAASSQIPAAWSCLSRARCPLSPFTGFSTGILKNAILCLQKNDSTTLTRRTDALA